MNTIDPSNIAMDETYEDILVSAWLQQQEED